MCAICLLGHLALTGLVQVVELAPGVRPAADLSDLACRIGYLWVPPGFAHGFVVLSQNAEFLYKTTDYWFPEHERTLLWNDATLNIVWPIENQPKLAAKDAAGKLMKDAECFE